MKHATALLLLSQGAGFAGESAPAATPSAPSSGGHPKSKESSR